MSKINHEEKYKDIPEDQHVIHMWEPLKFKVKKGYDYLRRGPLQTFFYHFWRFVVAVLLAPFSFVWYGFRIKGRNNRKALKGTGFVSVCNHVHPMDCVFINMAVMPRRLYILSLESNFRIPVINHIIKELGAVPIPTDPACTGEMLEALVTMTHSGSGVQIYPEGILRPYHNGLRSVKNGAFNLAVTAGVPLLPMAITFREPKGLYRLKKKPCITLNILPAIYPDKNAPRADEIKNLRERYIKLFEEVS